MLYCQTTPISKTLGQFENLVFVIMSTRENIRLIARSSLVFGIMSTRENIRLIARTSLSSAAVLIGALSVNLTLAAID